MDVRPLDTRAAASIEAAEARAWADAYSAAPADWAEEVGLTTRWIGDTLMLSWAATGRRYFSRTIGLGVVAPATEAAIDEVLQGYERSGITMFLLQSLPHCRPVEYERWLEDRGLEPFDRQDRIVRDDSPVASPTHRASERELVAERVTRDTADEWAEFLSKIYGLATGDWLSRLIDRPGWHQYVARENDAIVAARGMYIGPDGLAWLGMDAPVPGLWTDDFEPDETLCAFIVADGVVRGASGFLSDIEVPSPALDTPAYQHFARLGFRRPYVRTHFARL